MSNGDAVGFGQVGCTIISSALRIFSNVLTPELARGLFSKVDKDCVRLKLRAPNYSQRDSDAWI